VSAKQAGLGLGMMQLVMADDRLRVANMVTQHGSAGVDIRVHDLPAA
jgi:hypothetical protein